MIIDILDDIDDLLAKADECDHKDIANAMQLGERVDADTPLMEKMAQGGMIEMRDDTVDTVLVRASGSPVWVRVSRRR